MASPRKKPEPRSIIVAHAAVEGDVAVSGKAPATVRLQKGQPLHLKFTYRLREASRDQEEYRFELVSRLGDERDEPATAHWGDTWGYPEDIQGYVRQVYTPRKAGMFQLTWQAIAEYSVHGWGAAEEDVDVRRAARKGTLSVVVTEARA